MGLAIENSYGNVDLTSQRLTKRYIHIQGQRLQPICRTLGITFARAVVGFDGSSRYGYKPRFDGVVISVRSASKLLAASEERDRRAEKRHTEAVADLDSVESRCANTMDDVLSLAHCFLGGAGPTRS